MTMASIYHPPPLQQALPRCVYGRSGILSLSYTPLTLSVSNGKIAAWNFRVGAVRTESDGGRMIGSAESYGSGLLRRPSVPEKEEVVGRSSEDEDEDEDEEEENGGEGGEAEEESIVDWEDRILEDTVPLVGFVRMVLHSDKYESGDRLSPEHERMIVDRLLPYHPDCENKIGCGIDYIMVAHHPDFESSRCLFIVRKDGELVDFSYWKCIKGLIRKKYPLYADNFILRHFRKHRQNG